MRMIWVAFTAMGLFACGTHHDDGNSHGDFEKATLSISPPNSDLNLTPTTPGTEPFTATATWPDGSTEDVTDQVAFSIDASYGQFATATLSMFAPGKTQVVAAWNPTGDATMIKQATATVIGHMKSIRIDPTLPANIAELFGAATEDPTTAPQLVYPAPNVIVPRNLGDFEAHWIDAHGHDAFELSLHTEFTDVRIYVPGGNGQPFAGPEPSWAAFAADEWVAAVGNEKRGQYMVRGITVASPQTVGSAAPQLARLPNEQMLGGLYYWGIYDSVGGAPQVSGVWRRDMENPGQPAEEYLSTNNSNGNRCVACHVLSRDGTKMAITYSGGDKNATMVDVATKAAQPDVNAWNFGTFTPDGTELIGSHDGVLTLRNYADQSVIMNVPTGVTYASQPDLSADGHHLVFVSNESTCDWCFSNGAIVTMDYDQTTHTWGTPHTLVNADPSSNFYYPTWSPDGQWILFNRAAGSSYNNPGATAFVIKADGTGPALPLSIANDTGALTNSWPRWAPFGQSVGDSGEQMYWITMSSQRTYGVRRSLDAHIPSIWMFGFFPDKAAANMDGSTPAFRVPFQDFNSHNHIAQWAEKVVITN